MPIDPDERAQAIARLHDEIEDGRTGEIMDFLIEHLATYGTEGIDTRALARRIYERIEDGE